MYANDESTPDVQARLRGGWRMTACKLVPDVDEADRDNVEWGVETVGTVFSQLAHPERACFAAAYFTAIASTSSWSR